MYRRNVLESLVLALAMGLIFAFGVLSCFAQETLTITTYYPSPYGSYNELTVASRQAIGDVNGDTRVDSGDMAVDQSGNPVPGSLTVAGRVGIGTINPGSRLSVTASGSEPSDADDGMGGILQLTTGTGSATDNKLMFGYSDINTYAWIQSIKPGTSNRALFLNPRGGNVSIGSEYLSDYKLYVRNNLTGADINSAIPEKMLVATFLNNNQQATGISIYNNSAGAQGQWGLYVTGVNHVWGRGIVGLYNFYKDKVAYGFTPDGSYHIVGDRRPWINAGWYPGITIHEFIPAGGGSPRRWGLVTVGNGYGAGRCTSNCLRDFAIVDWDSGDEYPPNRAEDFIINGKARLYIDGDTGNVGIGMPRSPTTPPTKPPRRLSIFSNAANNQFLLMRHLDVPTAINYGWQIWIPDDGSLSFHENTTPGYAGSSRFWIAPGGDVKGTYGDYHVASDIRLKKDIVTIHDALKKVLALRGVNFRWKDPEKGQSLRMGMIGQEVEKVVPEAVHTSDDDMKTKSVEYQYLVPLLIEAVKELKGENDQLRQRVEFLEMKNEK